MIQLGAFLILKRKIIIKKWRDNENFDDDDDSDDERT
jgi:hypothetical protein